MDNRLDFISSFENNDEAVQEMSSIRAKLILIDEYLRTMAPESRDSALNRSIAMARTHIESALHYTIKSLCLKHEKKVAE